MIRFINPLASFRGEIAHPKSKRMRLIWFRRNGRKVGEVCDRIDDKLHRFWCGYQFGFGRDRFDNRFSRRISRCVMRHLRAMPDDRRVEAQIFFRLLEFCEFFGIQASNAS